MLGSIDSIETFGLVDGPGIRTVVFFNGCSLRCKYCHNPEMLNMKDKNISVDELVSKIIKNKVYFEKSNGGVTFSGGEPLLQWEFVLEVAKKLKKENIHIALDTAGVGINHYEQLLDYIDLVILDIKHLDNNAYYDLVGKKLEEVNKFIKSCIKKNKKLWIRQVVVPGIHDNDLYMKKLANYLNTLPNIEKIELIPYHKLGIEKYQKLGIDYPYKDKNDMSLEVCNQFYEKYFKK